MNTGGVGAASVRAATVSFPIPNGDVSLEIDVVYPKAEKGPRHDGEAGVQLCFKFSPRGQGVIVSVVNKPMIGVAKAQAGLQALVQKVPDERLDTEIRAGEIRLLSRTRCSNRTS